MHRCNRTNPYGVYPPVTAFRENGSPVTPQALCYVPDWYTGFYALMEYRNGTFQAEKFLNAKISPSDRQNDVIKKIIASYNNNSRTAAESMTFSEVYEEFFSHKYEKDQTRQYSRSSLDATRSAYKHAVLLHDKPFQSLRTDDLQEVIDNCNRKHATKEHIKNLFKQMYDYAYSHDLCDRNYADHDCRHTFSWLCDKYHVDALSKKMLLGHALGNDVTDLKYGHRTVEELREEINKIRICR